MEDPPYLYWRNMAEMGKVTLSICVLDTCNNLKRWFKFDYYMLGTSASPNYPNTRAHLFGSGIASVYFECALRRFSGNKASKLFISSLA